MSDDPKSRDEYFVYSIRPFFSLALGSLAENDESNRCLISGLWVTVIAGIILQHFIK